MSSKAFVKITAHFECAIILKVVAEIEIRV